MSDEMSEGFNFAEVDAQNMRVKRRGEWVTIRDGKIVVADNKEAYGGDAKTIAAMAAETVARVAGDAAQADRAYDQALEQAEQSPEDRLRRAKTKAWQVKNRIADASLEYDSKRNVWYLRYLAEDKETKMLKFRYREISESEMNHLGDLLQSHGVY